MKNIHYINAGAGSGKTWTLTDKLAKLIAGGETTPSRVILTTFTERAAEEFRQKARAMLVAKGLHERAAELDSAMIGTVHSVAFRFIQKYWYLLGLGAGVKPMPEEDTERYIAATLSSVATPEDMRVFGSYVERLDIKPLLSSVPEYDFWKEDVRSVIEKAETFSVDSLEDSRAASLKLFGEMFPDAAAGDPDREMQKDVMERVYRIAGEWRERFAAYKKEHDLVSFNDMERLFIRLLGMPQVREDIGGSVDYVFVDEFQDSNPTQVRIFDALSEIVGKGSFWVGDPKQAIYDFRGCDTTLTTAVTSIVEHRAARKEEGFKYRVLPDSWRSDPHLVTLVNEAFVPVFDGILSEDKVRLTPKRKAELPVDVPNAFHWDLTGQAKEGSNRLSYAKEVLWKAVAAQVSHIVHGEHSIRTVIDKDTKKARPVRPGDIAVLCRSGRDCDAVSAELRALGLQVSRETGSDASSREVSLLLAVLNYFIGNSSLLDAELAYLIEDASVEYILKEGESVRDLPVFTRLDALRERLRGKPVSYVVDSVITALDLENLVYKWDGGLRRLHVLESVKAMAASYENECLQRSEASTLGGFIGFLASNPVPVGRDIQEGGVNVLTYHSSKGLEWNVVIMCSLEADDLNQKDLLKRTYIGVNEQRLTAPTEENVYSDYVIRYIPRFLPSPNSSLSDGMTEALTAQPDYADRVEQVRGQASRLLYVGATRARDYLITVSTKTKGTKWLDTLGLKADFDFRSPEGPYHVWGSAAPMSWLRHISPDAVPGQNVEDTYCTVRPAESPAPVIPKYVLPSADGAAVDPESLGASQVLPAKGELAERITVTGTVDAYDAFGTCIHDILAAYRPGENGWNMAVAQRTVESFGFRENLRAPSEIVRAADVLFSFLERTYGVAVAVRHELPFMHVIPSTNQVVTGEMDLVWETEEGCVLVDFKNYPGYDDVLDPGSKFFVGKYAPQLKCYREALKGAGKTVLDTLVFYAVQGRCVRLPE
jgi:ATP-dependent exoDNAse (exonuclease V) beta subunit